MNITSDQLLLAHDELIRATFDAHYAKLGDGHEGSGMKCKNEDCVRRLKVADMLHAAAFAMPIGEQV